MARAAGVGLVEPDYPRVSQAWRPVLQVREPPVKQLLEARGRPSERSATARTLER